MPWQVPPASTPTSPSPTRRDGRGDTPVKVKSTRALRLRQVANPASSRLNDEPEADRARHSPRHDAESLTAGSRTHLSGAAHPTPRNRDCAECPAPEMALGDSERRHARGDLASQLAERAHTGAGSLPCRGTLA
jgi:hypothetical protein